MSTEPIILDDFREFLRLLNARGVSFLVVGGHAVSFYGHPRFTHDVDVVVLPNRENTERLLLVLEEFGYGKLGLGVDEFLTDTTIVFGRSPREIYITTYIKGVDLELAWNTRQSGALDSVPVNYIGKAELVANKRAAGRPEDPADVAWLTSG